MTTLDVLTRLVRLTRATRSDTAAPAAPAPAPTASGFVASVTDSGMFPSAAIDYSRASLSHIDAFVGFYHENDEAVPDEVAQGAGAYLVQTVRRSGASLTAERADALRRDAVRAVHRGEPLDTVFAAA